MNFTGLVLWISYWQSKSPPRKLHFPYIVMWSRAKKKKGAIKTPSLIWYIIKGETALASPFRFFCSATALLHQLQPLPPAGFFCGASFAVVFSSTSVPPAPAFSPLQAVAQPVIERPAPAIKLTMLKLAKSFFNSFLSISTLFYYRLIETTLKPRIRMTSASENSSARGLFTTKNICQIITNTVVINQVPQCALRKELSEL